MNNVTDTLSIREIGIISHNIKTSFLMNQSVPFNIPQALRAHFTNAEAASGCCIHIMQNQDTIIDKGELRGIIEAAINTCIGYHISEISSMLTILGFVDPVAAMNLYMTRINMAYTLLQLGSNEYNVIFL